MIWGDAFPDGGRPQVRRALAGADAHECMYSWVYLTELLAVREMLGQGPQTGSPHERFEKLRAHSPDPNNQMSRELPDVFVPAARLMDESWEFVELGSTFFASIEKIVLAARLLDKPLDSGKLLFSGIEYSPYMHQAARSLHPGHDIRLVKEPHQWSRSRERVFHVSRFVGSYAFRSTEAFAAEVARADAFHIIDAFSIDSEFQSWDLGLPITFFDVEKLVSALPDHDIYLGSATAEYHWTLQRKAMVLRLFGIKRGLGTHDEPLYQPGVGARIDASLSDAQWRAFATQKRHFPIWGGPSVTTQLPRRLGIDLHFSDEELAEAVARARWLE
ncbi:MAG: hypothetical protein FJX02_14105 [Alphaproteobacteria bacterium]|nr:hypothetical protein [Alphaproteobacteria bacterium]